MQIQLNGTPHQLDPGISLDQLIMQLDLSGQRFAVEVNAELVPRSLYAQHALQAGDRVEIVQAIGGG